jgi:hypothetical protein
LALARNARVVDNDVGHGDPHGGRRCASSGRFRRSPRRA